jgi:membrane dipeptidase
MKVIDSHCDAIYKMLLDSKIDFDGDPSPDVNYARLKQGNVVLQCFAVYLPEQFAPHQFAQMLEGIDRFHLKIASHPGVEWVRTRQDLERAVGSGKVGAMLTVEGADAIQGNSVYLRTLYRLGVRMLSLTWNFGNWAADGVLEPRNGGLTVKGKSFVKECGELGMLLDISHLSERAFWDAAEACAHPLAASHSNCAAVCPHPRNLTDEQIVCIIRRGGIVGLTFVPYFVANDSATMADLLRHIDHVASLGGERHIAFGSDFDGISEWIPGLEHPGHYAQFGEFLLNYYSSEQVERFLYRNWYDFLHTYLPDASSEN